MNPSDFAGNFAPIRSEDDFELEIAGELPSELSGVFYRNGSNPQFDGPEPRHWFLGDGMIHAFFLGGGRARYRNRWVRTARWTAENEAGRALFSGFGGPAPERAAAAVHEGGIANTNVVWHGGRLLALEEQHRPFVVDPDDLGSVGFTDDFGGKVTAHPKVDPETGEMIWFAYGAGPEPFSPMIAYGVTGADGVLQRRDMIRAPYSAMMHDFLVTRESALFPVLPLTGSLERARSGQPAFAWEPGRSAHLGVLRRDGPAEDVRWFETDACFVFHPVNAWEADGRIFADMMEFPEAPLFTDADGTPTQRTSARLVRWSVEPDGRSAAIHREPLDELAGEFPRFDERYTGRAYRHAWFAGRRGKGGAFDFDCLAHVDVVTGRRRTFEFKGGDSPGEPVFVPRDPRAPEGDGWLLVLVWRARSGTSDLAVFDAQSIESGPVALARLPRRVPFGFHGNWRPDVTTAH